MSGSSLCEISTTHQHLIGRPLLRCEHSGAMRLDQPPHQRTAFGEVGFCFGVPELGKEKCPCGVLTLIGTVNAVNI